MTGGWRIFLGLAAALLCLAGAVAGAQDMRFFRIGTGSTGGTYFPIGGLLASIISNPPGSRPCEKGGSCGVPGLIAVAQSTQGSVENINLIARGQLDSALAQADIAFRAYTGTGVYKETGPVESLRFIANLYPESLQIVVPRDSGIRTVADLMGKRVSIGEKESGTLVDALIILKSYGIGEKDFEAFYLKPGPSADLMRDGQIDALFLVAGVPTTAIAGLARDLPIDLVPIDGPEADRLIETDPYFARNIIPAETYEGSLETQTIAVGAQWVVGADVDSDLVYGVTRALWHENSRPLLDGGHPKGRQIRIETALKGMGIPLHPGAERYYLEVGTIGGSSE